jgi:hypothetical protein
MQLLELNPGITPISMNKLDDLSDAIRSIIEQVKFGGLDI